MSRRLFLLALSFVALSPLLSPSAAAAAFEVAGARFSIPSNWTPVSPEPASPARVGQWSLPQGGEAVAFYFGEGKGGDVPANLATLAKRMTTPTGGPSAPVGEGRTESKEIKTEWFSCYGVYQADPLRSGIPAVPKADWGLVGLVAQFPGGPVYFRITVPASAIRSLPRFGKPGGLLYPALIPPPPVPSAEKK